MDDVQLKFTPEALVAIAQQALKHKAGARGLRSILETAMLEIMYEIPSEDSVTEVIINEEVILNKEKPLVLYEMRPNKPDYLKTALVPVGNPNGWLPLYSFGMNLAWPQSKAPEDSKSPEVNQKHGKDSNDSAATTS